MSSRFTFPLRFLNKEILHAIVNYYDVQIAMIPLLDEVLLLDKDFSAAEPIDYINEIVERHREVLCDNDLVHIHNTEHTDHQQIYELTELFQELKLPYDSLKANELELLSYRPELALQPFEIAYHPAMDSGVFPIDVVGDVVFSEQDPAAAIKKLLLAFEQFGGTCPPIQQYTTVTGCMFIPMAVRNQNLFL